MIYNDDKHRSPHPIIVESLLTGAETDTSDIRDIKPPVSLPMSLAIIIWICVITLFIIIAIVAYFYYQKKKGDDVFDRSKPPPLPAHEIAFTELDELKRSNLLANGEIKEYYDRLSDIIRKYIENRYSIYALEMTSEQLLDHIENFPHHIQNNVIYDLQNLLQTSDLAKFAKYKPADHIHGELYDLATDFVKKTRFVLISERESIENKQLAEEISK